MRVLLVEDEQALRRGLTDLLEAAGHRVEAHEEGRIALAKGSTEPFDVVVLDLMLPDIDGIEVCRLLRQARPHLPILMLTARGSEEHKLAGFAAGADDYVTKPFGSRELLARLDALNRRFSSTTSTPDIMRIDGCDIDLGRMTARRDEAEHSLTPREASLLRYLAHHRARAVSRPELLQAVWGFSSDTQTRTVDMTVAKLRQKIEAEPQHPNIIVTVTGIGYAWGAGDDAEP